MPKTSAKDNDQSSGPVSEAKTTAPVGYSYRNFKAHLWLWLITAAGLTADLTSKRWAIDRLGDPEKTIPQPVEIIEGYVRLSTVLNTGAVGGAAAGKTTLLLCASVVAIVFLLWMFALSRSDQRLVHISLAMLLSGALGNMYDRIFNDGKVIDFIEINLHFWPANSWPTFNIADILLTVGVAVLLIISLFQKKA